MDRRKRVDKQVTHPSSAVVFSTFIYLAVSYLPHFSNTDSTKMVRIISTVGLYFGLLPFIFLTCLFALKPYPRVLRQADALEDLKTRAGEGDVDALYQLGVKYVLCLHCVHGFGISAGCESHCLRALVSIVTDTKRPTASSKTFPRRLKYF